MQSLIVFIACLEVEKQMMYASNNSPIISMSTGTNATPLVIENLGITKQSTSSTTSINAINPTATTNNNNNNDLSSLPHQRT
jgi:hypothetical protein